MDVCYTASFGSRFRVFDVVDFAHNRPQDIQNHTCIIVATFAAFRVKDTKGRPDLTVLDAAMRAQVAVTATGNERVVLHVTRPDAALLKTLAQSVANAKDKREFQLRAKMTPGAMWQRRCGQCWGKAHAGQH